MSDPRRLTTCIVAMIVFLSGCGSRRPAIEGRVTLDGEPIAYGSIMLVPVDGKGQTAGSGIANGLYRMEASAGPMKVIINSPKKTDRKVHVPTAEDTGTMADLYVDAVPPRYNEATELEVTVVPGRNTFDFALESEKSPRP